MKNAIFVYAVCFMYTSILWLSLQRQKFLEKRKIFTFKIKKNIFKNSSGYLKNCEAHYKILFQYWMLSKSVDNPGIDITIAIINSHYNFPFRSTCPQQGMVTIANVYLCDSKPAIDPECGLSSLIKLRRLRFQVARNIATIGRAVCQAIRNTLSRDTVTRRADFLRSDITPGESLMRFSWRYRARHCKYANIEAIVAANNFVAKKSYLKHHSIEK